MPFIGNQPALSYTSFAKQDFTTSATTSYTLDNPVANANELALFINFVRQEPTTAYSANSTTLTLTEATSVGDDMYCVYLGKAVQTVNPPNSSVGASQIVDASITSGKLASGVLPTNTPAFEAERPQSAQVVSDNTDTKVQFSIENFDTDNCYDNSTNYRFTPTVAGKYFVYARIMTRAETNKEFIVGDISLFKNGTKIGSSRFDNGGTSKVNNKTPVINQIVDMNGSSDYIECFGLADVGSGNAQFYNDSAERTIFGAYKLIGV